MGLILPNEYFIICIIVYVWHQLLMIGGETMEIFELCEVVKTKIGLPNSQKNGEPPSNVHI